MSVSAPESRSRNIILKSLDEILLLKEANRIVAETLTILQDLVEPGISTLDLDKAAEEKCLKMQAKPAFKGYRGFPGSLCVSLNEEVVHGIPSKKRKLKKGDIVSIDFGVFFRGFYGDSALTLAVGDVSDDISKLLIVTQESLDKGIAQAVVGNRVSDISKAIQAHVEMNGFSVVRQFVGHGIGTSLHEAPEIPNFYKGERTSRLLPGMVLAIEPMVNMGTHRVKVMRDGWTVITEDGKCSAHFEHSVAITEDGPMILSSREN